MKTDTWTRSCTFFFGFLVPTLVSARARTLLTDGGEVFEVIEGRDVRHFFPLDPDQVKERDNFNPLIPRTASLFVGELPTNGLSRRQDRTKPELGDKKDESGNSICYSPQVVSCGSGCCKDSDWCYEGGCCARNLNGCDGLSCYDPAAYLCCKGGYQCFLGKDCCAEGCCDYGWKCCDSGRCCQQNAECCKGGGCCNDGKRCVVDLRNGQKGCYLGDLSGATQAGPNPGAEVTVTVPAPIALPPTTVIITKTAVPAENAPTASSNNPPKEHNLRFCRDPGYILCPDSHYCCPPSAFCFLDGTGTQKCNPESTYVFSYFYPWSHGSSSAWYLGSTTYRVSAARVTGPVGNLWQETQVAITTPPAAQYTAPHNLDAEIENPPKGMKAEDCDQRCFPIKTLGETEKTKTVTVVEKPTGGPESQKGDSSRMFSGGFVRLGTVCCLLAMWALA